MCVTSDAEGPEAANAVGYGPLVGVICKAIPAGVILLTAKMNLEFIGLVLLPAEDLAETNTQRTLAQCRGSRNSEAQPVRRERGVYFVFRSLG